ncbi:hypothetical protein D1872_314740 [compost metagenome]
MRQLHQLHELAAQTESIFAPCVTGQRFGVFEAEFAGVAPVLELLGERRHRRRKAQIVAGFANRSVDDPAFDQATIPTFR